MSGQFVLLSQTPVFLCNKNNAIFAILQTKRLQTQDRFCTRFWPLKWKTSHEISFTSLLPKRSLLSTQINYRFHIWFLIRFMCSNTASSLKVTQLNFPCLERIRDLKVTYFLIFCFNSPCFWVQLYFIKINFTKVKIQLDEVIFSSSLSRHALEI